MNLIEHGHHHHAEGGKLLGGSQNSAIGWHGPGAVMIRDGYRVRLCGERSCRRSWQPLFTAKKEAERVFGPSPMYQSDRFKSHGGRIEVDSEPTAKGQSLDSFAFRAEGRQRSHRSRQAHLKFHHKFLRPTRSSTD